MMTDGIAVVVVKDEEELQPPEPMPVLHGPLPPFLMKTFKMVEDEETDGIVSWSMERNSFIVWDPYRLSNDLLPRYFKHGNFSTFIRQLNTYDDKETSAGDMDKLELLRFQLLLRRGFPKGDTDL